MKSPGEAAGGGGAAGAQPAGGAGGARAAEDRTQALGPDSRRAAGAAAAALAAAGIAAALGIAAGGRTAESAPPAEGGPLAESAPPAENAPPAGGGETTESAPSAGNGPPAERAAAAAPRLAAAPVEGPGQEEHSLARQRLDAGDFAGAVESAFEALLRSREFTPEDWGGEAPEGNLVLDDFAGAAAAGYRATRHAYRATLAAALAGAGDYAGAEAEYRRLIALAPRSEHLARLADLPGVAPGERVRLLLRAWAAAPANERGAALERLRESGAFRTANGLAAALDRFRFDDPDAFRGRPPEGLELRPTPFPALTIAVEGGAYSTERSFGEGRALLLYFPGRGCPRCGELIGDLQIALRERRVDAIFAADDAELTVLRRAAELTGAGLFQPEPQTAAGRSALTPRPVAHVARQAALDFRPGRDAEETLWLAARGGLTVLRARLGDGDSPRRLVAALFDFLDDSPVAGGPEPLASAPAESDAPEAFIEALLPLEAGGEPLADLERALLGSARNELRGETEPAARARRLLAAAAGLRGSTGAKLRLLEAMVSEFGTRTLEAAQARDALVIGPAAGGTVAAAVGRGAGEAWTAVLREYERYGGGRRVLAVTVREVPGGGPGIVRALDLFAGRVGQTAAREDGFAFSWSEGADRASCAAWGPPEGPLEQRCPAEIGPDGDIFVRAPQLIAFPGEEGPPADGPEVLLRAGGGGERPEAALLGAGREAAAAGDLAAAETAFREALEAVGPGSPVDAAAVRYDLAVVRAARGERDEALAALLALGDASFPATLERTVARLYREGR